MQQSELVEKLKPARFLNRYIYSMGFLPKKTQVFLDWLKIISSCGARKVVSTVKISASNVVSFGRYKVHKFSWKILYFAKNQKLENFVTFTILLLHNETLIAITYSCSPWFGAFARISFLNFYSYGKNVSWATQPVNDKMRVFKIGP